MRIFVYVYTLFLFAYVWMDACMYVCIMYMQAHI